MTTDSVPPDPWLDLRRLTAARIALGRTGVSLPTHEWLRFAQAHAMARDAVHTPFDSAALAAQLRTHGFDTHTVHSAAADRPTYLRRPDLGRRLGAAAAGSLQALADASKAGAIDVAVVVADGLSPRAVQSHALPLLLALRPMLEAQPPVLSLGPVVLAHQARVALGDDVGAVLGARAMLLLVGERPGLSSPDSLGAYLTWAPQVGRTDAERNCVSNIRPEGLPIEPAAARIAWLLNAAHHLGLTGVRLKDQSPVGRSLGQ
jgi:ethanolamine ammonia-lyase small subunit